jgi:hypothetical protein
MWLIRMVRMHGTAETGMILPALALLAAGQAQAVPTPVSAPPEAKRCVSETSLGSRVARKICRTEREWAQLKETSRARSSFHPKNGGVGFTNN